VSNTLVLTRRVYDVGCASQRGMQKEPQVSMKKYLLIQRSTPGNAERPSPAQMQEMYAAFSAWKEKFKENISDMGGKLATGGKIVSASGVMDGPLVESKEVIGGYMLVTAPNYELAIEIARECPGVIRPGSSVEIREISQS
jgi:hypothetical protein